MDTDEIQTLSGCKMLLQVENLPGNTFYDDAAPIDEVTLDVIRTIYERTKLFFQGQKNGLLLLDNMLFKYGREPFEGQRKTLVGMIRSYSAKQTHVLA